VRRLPLRGTASRWPAVGQVPADADRGPIGGPFALIDHTGKPRTDQDFRGKLLLNYFGYSYCPDVCPTDLQQIGLAVDGLGSEGEKLVTKELERLQPRPSRTCWLGLRWRPSSGPRDILGCRKIKSTPRKGANLKGLITERLEIVVLPAWSIATAANRRDAGRTASGERRRRAALPYLTISPDTPKSYAIGS